MGDRGNIRVIQTKNVEKNGKWTTKPGASIWLYTHRTGSDVAQVAHRALAKRWRWNDDTYLTRIVYDELAKGNYGTETSFGIGTELGDNEHVIVELDVAKQEVRFVDHLATKPKILETFTFEKFAGMTELAVATAFDVCDRRHAA